MSEVEQTVDIDIVQVTTEGAADPELMDDETEDIDFGTLDISKDLHTPDPGILVSNTLNSCSLGTGQCVAEDNSLPEYIEEIKPGGPAFEQKVPAIPEQLARSPTPVFTKCRRAHREEEDLSDEESGRESKGLKRSAVATQKLRKLMKSGELVVDEQKRATYEKKCVEMDVKARFRYQNKWEVLHSRCGKWFTMSEPYNTTKFKLHVGGCDSKGQNTLIDDFFKRQDGVEKGTPVKTGNPGGRKHIVIGGRQSKTSAGKNTAFTLPSCAPEPKLQACRGIGKEHHDRIAVYISRALTDGAGSRSESAITAMVFGDGVKYSQLDEESRSNVLAVQVKLRSWIICRELQVIYSTKCCNFITPGPGISATCDKCLALLKLDTFKKALRMDPPSLETAKFTPRRQYNGLKDLGINYAKIKGLAGLLDDVSLITS